MNNIGKTLKGFCNGYFGRSYNDKIIEGEGKDWLVAREVNQIEKFNFNPKFAFFASKHEKNEMVKEWTKESD